MSSALDSFLAPLEAEGVALLDSEKAALEAQLTTVNTSVVNEVTTVVADNLPKKGVLALLDGGLKVAILSAKPELVTALGHTEHAFIDMVENALKADLARRTTAAQAAAGQPSAPVTH